MKLGLASLVSPEGPESIVVSGVIVSVSWNFWIRLLARSTTYTWSVDATATPEGPLNWLVPVPRVPQVVMKVPDGLNFWIRLLPVSATMTLSWEPVATSSVVVTPNWPFPVPALPHLVMKVPEE